MIEQQIKDIAYSLGIDLIGFSNSGCLSEIKDNISKQPKSFITPFQANLSGYEQNNTNFIAIALSYAQSKVPLTKNEVTFADFSIGQDYHLVLMNKMNNLITYLKEFFPNDSFKPLTDTDPLCNRSIAYNAGIGFFGKNNLLINNKYGSYLVLGYIQSTHTFIIDKPVDKNCLSCNNCIKACPGQALNNKYLDGKKCLSYLTQSKENLTKGEEDLFNQTIYGCDICQEVCPHNIDIPRDIHPEFKPTGVEIIDIYKYEPLSNKQFKIKYGHLTGAWRGKATFERNIKLYKRKLEK